MWLLIDGDNSPGEGRTIGSDRLHPTRDKLVVFYAEKNPYYTIETNRDKLRQNTSCDVVFCRIDKGSNAVDFAMAIYAGNICSAAGNDGLHLTLISGDKHMEIIERELANLYSTCRIKCVQTVEEAIFRYQLIEAESEDEIRTALCNQYGKLCGQKLYFKLRDCFVSKQTTTSKTLKSRTCSALTAIMGIKHRKD